MIPVILAGGSGSRLWPLSRHLHPKQFWPLCGEQSMLCQTLLRARSLPGTERPILVCHQDHRFLAAEQLRICDCTDAEILLEPEARNTAPAIAVAALCALERTPDACLLVLPADHILDDLETFATAVQAASELAEREFLVSLGVAMRSPETGYGYILRGGELGASGFAVRRFIEKPSPERAREYFADGGYFWNSGMFIFRAARFWQELEEHAPEMAAACRKAHAEITKDFDFRRLPAEAYADCPSDSIDYAVMEKTGHAAVTPLNCAWNDAGSWSVLWEEGERDDHGNALLGDVVALDAHDNYLRSESKLLAVFGVRDLIVVETPDAVLVTQRERAQEIRSLVDELHKRERQEVETPARVFRPWGFYQTLESGERFQVKRIGVNPGQKISLQMHHQRAEHWIVVRGTATVVCEDKEFTLETDQSTYIPLGSRHRLANDTEDPLEVIEVQSGVYLGEDDIVRFADAYGR